MMELEKIIRSCLDSNSTQVLSGKVTLKSGKEIFSFFQEIKDFFLRKRSLDRVLDLFQNGQEKVWSPEDPVPFFALHYLQIPILFVQAIFNGQIWNKIDFGLEQDFLSYQD